MCTCNLTNYHSNYVSGLASNSVVNTFINNLHSFSNTFHKLHPKEPVILIIIMASTMYLIIIIYYYTGPVHFTMYICNQEGTKTGYCQ